MNMPEENKEKIIEAVFKKDHDWVRHLDTAIIQVNSLAIGGSSAIMAYFITLRWGGTRPPAEFSFLLVVPILITGFAIWSTHALVSEVQSVYTRLIKIERHWGVYDKGGLIPNEVLYEDRYQRSDRNYPDIPRHLMVVQLIVLALTLFVAGLSLTR